MDSLIREQFFSRQGKATKHFFNGFRSWSPRDPPKEARPDSPINPSKLLEELLKEKHLAKLNEKKPKQSSFFQSVERDFSLEESDSPGAGHYSPRFNALDPRLNQGPRYYKANKNPKIPKVYLPRCINSDFQCCRKGDNHLGDLDSRINKTVIGLDDYDTKVMKFRNFTPIPEKLSYKIASPIQLNLQKPRDPFIKENSGPNEKRFDYIPSKNHILTKFKRPESVDFGKLSGRTEEEIRHSPGPYDKNQEYVMPKLVTNVPDFSKQLKRKTLLLEHMLRTPNSPELGKIQKAYLRQGNVKEPTKLPLMKTLTARDDSMYKVTEGYSLNTRRSNDFE